MLIKLTKNQSGVSLIAAIFIIVILAFMGMVFLTLLTTTSSTSINELQSTQALYVAEGGMERSIRYFTSPTLTERIACASIPSTNTALGSGEFSLTIEAGSPFYSSAATTLSFAIGAADATINVSSTAGYASFGRIMIDRELIDYTGTTANSFTGALRGRDGTTAVSHTSGTRVGQDQCTVTSTGGVYNLTTPNARRQVREGIQIQEGWAVGNLGAPPTTENLNSIYCTSSTNCWAVGNDGVILQWDGSSWSLDDTSGASRDLFSIHCPDANNCWAAGDRREGILYWNGAWSTTAPNGSPPNLQQDMYSIFMISTTSGWTVGNTGDGYRFTGSWAGSDPTNRDLMSVHCPTANNCWAVGDRRVGVLYWNGVGWSTNPNPGLNPNLADNLNSVFMLSTTSGWAVGENGRIYRYSGTPQWSNTGSITGEDLNEVHCPDANNCWTVGTNGVIFRWTQVGGWQSQASNTTEDLNSLYCVTSADCWAVGDNGTVLHWDGTNWSSTISAKVLRWNGAIWTDASGLLPGGANQNLNSISMLSYADGWMAGSRINNTTSGWNFLHWNDPTSAIWNGITVTTAGTNARNLNSVYMTSSADGWSVGNRINNNPNGWTFLRWTGAWNRIAVTTAGVNAQNLNSVYMLDTNSDGVADDGWSVGNRIANSTTGWTFLRWTGAWNRITVTTAGVNAQNLNSVYMTSSIDGWAVGNRSGNNPNGWTFLRWTGAWNRIAVTTAGVNAQNLNSVYMLDTNSDGVADDGWSVGNRIANSTTGWTFLRWNNPTANTWNRITVTTTANAQNLNEVFCINSNDCWAVGNGGTILHWDGNSWSEHSQSRVITTVNLNSIYVIGPKQWPQAMWREVFQ